VHTGAYVSGSWTGEIRSTRPSVGISLGVLVCP
jgi:hypothetical protein